jgi:dynein heavy chain
MKNSLEGIVIKWAFQIDQVLKESSVNLLDGKNHPTPMAEVRFWESRRKNLTNIYDQLRDPRVKAIGVILETIKSVYSNTFRSTFKNVVTALHESSDITLYFTGLVSEKIYFQGTHKFACLRIC